MKHQNTSNVKAAGRRIKTEGYSHSISDARTQLRQKEADLRQGEYERLTLRQRLERAAGRRGYSDRERARLSWASRAELATNSPQ